MDATVLEKVLSAFEETHCDALNRGCGHTAALRSAFTAAAMCLAALTGVEERDFGSSWNEFR